ncbi:MAG TPA: hypothetical protein VHV83_04375, partial [Armatimonadota bacterium]|nr:hypothetical protein [Armatimonadota bacterium]
VVERGGPISIGGDMGNRAAQCRLQGHRVTRQPLLNNALGLDGCRWPCQSSGGATQQTPDHQKDAETAQPPNPL